MMDRRAFITALAGGLLAAPLAAKGAATEDKPSIGDLAHGLALRSDQVA
jgi:hypothetical protein